jgi:hypothetical protein
VATSSSQSPGDAHILKHVLHDWDDEHCVAILRSCRNATVDGGRLVVIEEALPPAPLHVIEASAR